MKFVQRELLERRLGHVLLEHLEPCEMNELVPSTDNEAVDILEQIRDILDRETLDDFACVEEIVALLLTKGISTSRHDFG